MSVIVDGKDFEIAGRNDRVWGDDCVHCVLRSWKVRLYGRWVHSRRDFCDIWDLILSALFVARGIVALEMETWQTPLHDADVALLRRVVTCGFGCLKMCCADGYRYDGCDTVLDDNHYNRLWSVSMSKLKTRLERCEWKTIEVKGGQNAKQQQRKLGLHKESTLDSINFHIHFSTRSRFDVVKRQ